MSSENPIKIGRRGFSLFVNEYKGEPKIHIRKIYQDSVSGERFPTKCWITLSLQEWSELFSSTNAVEDELRRLAQWAGEENRRANADVPKQTVPRAREAGSFGRARKSLFHPYKRKDNNDECTFSKCTPLNDATENYQTESNPSTFTHDQTLERQNYNPYVTPALQDLTSDKSSMHYLMARFLALSINDVTLYIFFLSFDIWTFVRDTIMRTSNLMIPYDNFVICIILFIS